jgi:uncharacterized protein YegP (UPF0339 family)
VKKDKYLIELFNGKDGWRWRIVARNGRILASSEAYSTRHKCLRTVMKFVDYCSITLLRVRDK